jgi:hypothetical protein
MSLEALKESGEEGNRAASDWLMAVGPTGHIPRRVITLRVQIFDQTLLLTEAEYKSPVIDSH